MKVFEFKQIESGSNFRIEIDYHHYMQKQTAWLDGDILEMGEKPLELVNARLYVDDELKYSSNVVSGQGHPDNESVQAARRICEKRGYDWRTGEKIPAFKTKGLKTDELKTVTVEIKDLDL